MRILQARILEWVACPPPGDLPNPGVKPRSPALQGDSLLAEPPGKPSCYVATSERSWSRERGKGWAQEASRGACWVTCGHFSPLSLPPGAPRVPRSPHSTRAPQLNRLPSNHCCCPDALSGLTLCDPIDCSPPASSSVGCPGQGYWSGLPFSPSGDRPNSGIEPKPPALAGGFFTNEPPGKLPPATDRHPKGGCHHLALLGSARPSPLCSSEEPYLLPCESGWVCDSQTAVRVMHDLEVKSGKRMQVLPCSLDHFSGPRWWSRIPLAPGSHSSLVRSRCLLDCPAGRQRDWRASRGCFLLLCEGTHISNGTLLRSGDAQSIYRMNKWIFTSLMLMCEKTYSVIIFLFQK